jgi:Fe-S-cluster containining protein
MEYWWEDTDSGKHKYLEKTVFYSHFVQHNSHTDRPEVETVLPRWDANQTMFRHSACLFLTSCKRNCAVYSLHKYVDTTGPREVKKTEGRILKSGQHTFEGSGSVN